MENTLELLGKIGLSPGESKIYLALLEIGLTSVGSVISKSGVSGSKVYKILDRLISRGLVSSIVKDKVRQFKAESPDRLKEIIKEKEKEIININQELEKNMDYFLSKARISEEKSTCSVYEGFSGLKSVFDNALREIRKGEIMEVLGVTESTDEIRNFFVNFYREQARKRFNIKILFDETGKYKAEERKNKFTSFRFLPSGIITPATIVLYNDKTIINVGKRHFVITILIKNKEITDSFRVYFQQLWKSARKNYNTLR